MIRCCQFTELACPRYCITSAFFAKSPRNLGSLAKFAVSILRVVSENTVLARYHFYLLSMCIGAPVLVASLLLQGFLPEICPQNFEHRGAMPLKIRMLSHTLRCTLFFPEVSGGMICTLRFGPRIWLPFCAIELGFGGSTPSNRQPNSSVGN